MKRKTYTVQATLNLMVSTDVRAESLADAVEQSKALNESDFVTIPEGNFIDGNIKITGVFEE